MGHTPKACRDAAVPRQPHPQDWWLCPPETSHVLPQLSPTPLGKRCTGGHGWRWAGRGAVSQAVMAGVSGAVTLRKALEGLGRSKVRKEAPSPLPGQARPLL